MPKIKTGVVFIVFDIFLGRYVFTRRKGRNRVKQVLLYSGWARYPKGKAINKIKDQVKPVPAHRH